MRAEAAAEGKFLTGLPYLDPKAEDLHVHFKTSATPLNQLGVKELCQGSEMLDKINASLR